jgi:hypothetical protein
MTPADEARFINSRVFALRLQVVQEHDALATDRYDGRGQASMTYTPGPIADEEVLSAQFAAELRQQTPIRPGSALLVAGGVPRLDSFDGHGTLAEIKASGVIVDGASTCGAVRPAPALTPIAGTCAIMSGP